jgi:molybdenum cofactor cytidylyltransferase
VIVGVLLAAGLGSRFGGDKLLHAISTEYCQQSTPLAIMPMGLVSALNLALYVDEVICVVRPEDKVLASLFEQYSFKVCVSEHYWQGLSASLMAGVEASIDADAWWIALGDMPFINAASYQAIHEQVTLQKELPEAQQKIVRPYTLSQSGRKPGHPVVFPKRLKDSLLNLSGDEGAKVILKKERENLIEVQLNDNGIHLDVDEKKDLP